MSNLNTISGQILWLDDMRKLCKENYDIWVNNQKATRDAEWGRFCKEQQKIVWADYLKYRRILVSIGIDTGDWQLDDIKYVR